MDDQMFRVEATEGLVNMLLEEIESLKSRLARAEMQLAEAKDALVEARALLIDGAFGA